MFLSMDNLKMHFSFSEKVMRAILLAIVVSCAVVSGYGFDAGASCSEKSSRRGRAELLRSIPCDLSIQAFCNLPGNSYPWNAVRRFVHENQGLMRRMYGDVRHISVLRDEINNNNIDDQDIEEASARYSRTAWKRNKHLHVDSGKAKGNDLIDEPIRRRTATKSTTRMTTTPTTTSPITIEIAAKRMKVNESEFNAAETELESEIVATVEEIFVQLQDDEDERSTIGTQINGTIDAATIKMENATTKLGAVSDLKTNKTEAATISTTLRIFSKTRDRESETSSTTTSMPTVTQTTTVRNDEVSKATTKGVDENVIKTSDDEDDEPIDGKDETDRIDSHGSESIPAETIVDIDGKPQLFQDAEKEQDTTFQASRGVNACPVKEEVVAPFWANNTRGEVLALLNLYPFEQYVHWEKCTHEHKQMYCRDGCRCEQQYRLHRLLAYDPHNECRGIFSDWFRFPSCCICKCYDIPFEYRVTSRSPRTMAGLFKPADDRAEDDGARHPLDIAEEQVQRAIYSHATSDWYRRPFEEQNDEYGRDDVGESESEFN